MDCLGAEHKRSAGAAAGGEVPDAVRPEREDGLLINGLFRCGA
jgi:hypothetical protein